MSEEKKNEAAPPQFLVVFGSTDGLRLVCEGGGDLRVAKKTASGEATKSAKPGDKVLVYERRWSSTAKYGELVLEPDPEPEAEPKPGKPEGANGQSGQATAAPAGAA